jgi:hypothetical protein
MYSRRNTVAVWEYGGVTRLPSGELMIQSFTLQFAPLEIGGEYWFQLEEDWLMPSPVFSILSAATIPGPGEKKIPQVNFCNIVNEKGRWLTQAPLMEWHSSLFKKFGGVFALDSDLGAAPFGRRAA